jgi:outer membrane receptor for ferrienterochelin and colicin
MKLNCIILRFTLLCLLSFGGTAYSQVTTSTLSGHVSDNEGALPGATVMVVHVPTGTVTGAVTDAKGDYRLHNLRPGGPYRISFSYIGYKTQEHQDVTLVLADVYVLNVLLEQDSRMLDEIVVIGNLAPSNMNSERAGAITSITSGDIARMPTVSRSINDMTRLTPQANGSSIGGGNYRQNFVTVDGAAFNNAFGIGGNLPGGGSPISIDALDQISVSLTPYDIRQSGFIGGAINAVTKSGTNMFRGSAYHYRTDDRLRGNKVGDDYFSNPPSETKLYGITLGGPILKEKLFFFVNFETEKTFAPGPARVASTTGIASGQTIARPTAAELMEISEYLRTKHGYETGPYQGYSFESPGKKFLARIDWNINRNHQFNMRYSYMDGKSPNNPSTSSAYNLGAGGRQGMNAMWYQNSGYFQENNFSSLSGELNSRFGGGKFNNTLRATYSYQYEPRSTGGKTFPFVDIMKDGTAFTSFGTELFSYGNLREVNTYNITDEVKFNIGFNNLTAGLTYEMNHTKNGFQRQGTGHYVFESWDDFKNGENPIFYTITYSNAPGYKQAFPSFKFNQFSLYLQDEIKIGKNLNITGGIRLDLPFYPEYPEALQEHPMISKLSFNGTTYNTAVMPKTQLMLSPRFGFNYDVTGDRTIVVRGGTGIFTGRTPFVWICSQSGDAGMLQGALTWTGKDNTPGPFNPNINAYLPAQQAAAGTQIPTGGFTIMDPDFKFPQAWKSSLAVDFKLPLGFNASIEGVYNKDINAVMVRNMGLVDPVAMNISGYPDHRMMYPNNAERYIHRLDGAGQPAPTGANGAQPLLFYNVKDNGYYASLTFKLEKQLWEGLSGMIAYTRSWAQSLHDGSGDQAISLWRGYVSTNGSNMPELGNSSFVMPNNLIGVISYKYKSFTTSLFYVGGEDGRTSYTYTNNIVQDGNSFNGINLLYIPKNASEITFVEKTVGGVTYTPQEQSDAFFQYIEQDPYLKTRKGQYAEKNALTYPWAHRFDVKFTQDFGVKVGNTQQTIQLGLDITNVGNLLNPNWGCRWSAYQPQLLEVTNSAAVTPNGNVAPTFRFNHIAGTNDLPKETFRKYVGDASTFRMQFSIRYLFN